MTTDLDNGGYATTANSQKQPIVIEEIISSDDEQEEDVQRTDNLKTTIESVRIYVPLPHLQDMPDDASDSPSMMDEERASSHKTTCFNFRQLVELHSEELKRQSVGIPHDAKAGSSLNNSNRATSVVDLSVLDNDDEEVAEEDLFMASLLELQPENETPKKSDDANRNIKGVSEKAQPSNKKQSPKKKRVYYDPENEYDLEDDFIDDSELFAESMHHTLNNKLKGQTSSSSQSSQNNRPPTVSGNVDFPPDWDYGFFVWHGPVEKFFENNKKGSEDDTQGNGAAKKRDGKSTATAIVLVESVPPSIVTSKTSSNSAHAQVSEKRSALTSTEVSECSTVASIVTPQSSAMMLDGASVSISVSDSLSKGRKKKNASKPNALNESIVVSDSNVPDEKVASPRGKMCFPKPDIEVRYMKQLGKSSNPMLISSSSSNDGSKKAKKKKKKGKPLIQIKDNVTMLVTYD